MCSILISINPEYVERIFNGSKTFEFRRKPPKRAVDKILIYETSPVMKVVGEAEVIEVLAMSPDDLWDETRSHAGISKLLFDKYFCGQDIGYAYRLGKVTKYEEPLDLGHYGIKRAPQSFMYVQG